MAQRNNVIPMKRDESFYRNMAEHRFAQQDFKKRQRIFKSAGSVTSRLSSAE